MVDGGKGNGKEHREFFLFNTELFVFFFFWFWYFFFFVLLNMVVRCLTWWCLFVFFYFFWFCFFIFFVLLFFFNIVLTWKFVEVSKAYIVLTWKFVEVSKASVLYIYIYIYRLTYIWAGRLGYNFKRGSSFLKGAQIFFF